MGDRPRLGAFSLKSGLPNADGTWGASRSVLAFHSENARRLHTPGVFVRVSKLEIPITRDLARSSGGALGSCSANPGGSSKTTMKERLPGTAQM
jgi:tRNA A37 threonylcarbamoyladenosine synthetase subunit TsaC/SUA5/YrdC